MVDVNWLLVELDSQLHPPLSDGVKQAHLSHLHLITWGIIQVDNMSYKPQMHSWYVLMDTVCDLKDLLKVFCWW